MGKLSVLAGLILLCGWAVAADTGADLVVVNKSARRLMLYKDGVMTASFAIALGAHPVGQKQREGDGRTPEGRYVLDYKKADSHFYRAIHIGYPDPGQTLEARQHGLNPGGLVMIHGQRNGLGWAGALIQQFDWTDGCVALSNQDMEKVWRAVQAGTQIVIQP